MRAIKNKHGTLTMISLEESRLLSKIEMNIFVPLNTLSEREAEVANELYRRNLLRRGKKNSDVGYKVLPKTPI